MLEQLLLYVILRIKVTHSIPGPKNYISVSPFFYFWGKQTASLSFDGEGGVTPLPPSSSPPSRPPQESGKTNQPEDRSPRPRATRTF